MNSKYKYLAKNTSLLTISNFSSKLLAFFLVPIYTGILSTSEYGTYDLIITTIQLLMPIITVNICDGVMRYLMDSSISKNEVVSIGLKYVVISVIVTCVTIVLCRITGVTGKYREFETTIGCYYFAYVIHQYSSQVARGMEKVKELAIAGVVGTFATIIFNLLFLLEFRLGLKGFFWAYILGMVVPAIYLLYTTKIQNYLTKSMNQQLEHEMICYSFPLVMNALGWWANSVSDRYIVTLFCGIAANGVYSISYKIPTILNTIQGIFTQSWQISAIKEYDSEDSDIFFQRTTDLINCVLTLICSVLIILSRLLGRILYANDFFDAWKYVPFLLVSCVINAISGMVGPVLAAEKNSKALATSAFIGAVVNILLNIILVLLIGVQGAAVATLISSFVIFTFRRRYVKHAVVKSMKSYYFSWLILTLQSFFMIYMPDFFIGPIFLFVLIALYRTQITDILKMITFRKN